jgi:hypothetical protein
MLAVLAALARVQGRGAGVALRLGDVGGCHRMMGCDQAFMREANARFVVLRSQAEPGVLVCRLAIRHRQHSVDDLLSAHLRVRERAG